MSYNLRYNMLKYPFIRNGYDLVVYNYPLGCLMKGGQQIEFEQGVSFVITAIGIDFNMAPLCSTDPANYTQNDFYSYELLNFVKMHLEVKEKVHDFFSGGIPLSMFLSPITFGGATVEKVKLDELLGEYIVLYDDFTNILRVELDRSSIPSVFLEDTVDPVTQNAIEFLKENVIVSLYGMHVRTKDARLPRLGGNFRWRMVTSSTKQNINNDKITHEITSYKPFIIGDVRVVGHVWGYDASGNVVNIGWYPLKGDLDIVGNSSYKSLKALPLGGIEGYAPRCQNHFELATCTSGATPPPLPAQTCFFPMHCEEVSPKSASLKRIDSIRGIFPEAYSPNTTVKVTIPLDGTYGNMKIKENVANLDGFVAVRVILYEFEGVEK